MDIISCPTIKFEITMSFFAAAAWLVSGSAPTLHHASAKDLGIVRDLHAMKDAETKGGAYALPLPRHVRWGNGRNSTHHQAHRPPPKMVARKDPTRGKKKKDRAKSNRLGRVLLSR